LSFYTCKFIKKWCEDNTLKMIFNFSVSLFDTVREILLTFLQKKSFKFSLQNWNEKNQEQIKEERREEKMIWWVFWCVRENEWYNYVFIWYLKFEYYSLPPKIWQLASILKYMITCYLFSKATKWLVAWLKCNHVFQ
jgi:hypothetical protein